MGAKRYAYEDKNGVIHITVAGVNKRKGAEELAKMGGLDAFNDDMIFVTAGGTTATYNDVESNPLITASGNVLRLTSNVYISDTTKHISRDGAYILLTDIDPEERNNYIKFNYQMCKEYVNTIDI
jgi:3D (Asp-Asp-Asp) domain-containing protein